MTYYREKPVIIEAVRWTKVGDHPQVKQFSRSDPHFDPTHKHLLCGDSWDRHGWIDTLEDGYTVCPRDYVITGTYGEIYPIKSAVFDETYEKVPDPKPKVDPALKFSPARSLSQAMQIENAGGGPA